MGVELGVLVAPWFCSIGLAPLRHVLPVAWKTRASQCYASPCLGPGLPLIVGDGPSTLWYEWGGEEEEGRCVLTIYPTKKVISLILIGVLER